jgi:hypothetical protein
LPPPLHKEVAGGHILVLKIATTNKELDDHDDKDDNDIGGNKK